MIAPQRPKFSICIPCFNHEKYIGATIESVLAQTYTDFEIIVADNASTDGSLKAIESFDDPRLHVIRNRYNIGFAPNLQQVTRDARGEFVNLLSSDDIMQPTALETYAEVIEKHSNVAEELVLMSQAWEIDGNGETVRYIAKTSDEDLAPRRFVLPSEKEIAAQAIYERMKGDEVFSNCMKSLNTAGLFCSVVYARNLWESVEGYNSVQLMNPDMDFVLKILKKSPTVLFVNRPLYSYRKHEMGQAAQQSKSRTLKFQVDQYKYLMRFDSQWLHGTGVSQVDQRRLFIERDCIHKALLELAAGQWTMATRLLAFAWSTYPDIVIRSRKAWVLAGLLAVGPIGMLALKAGKRAFRRDFGKLPQLPVTKPADTKEAVA